MRRGRIASSHSDKNIFNVIMSILIPPALILSVYSVIRLAIWMPEWALWSLVLAAIWGWVSYAIWWTIKDHF